MDFTNFNEVIKLCESIGEGAKITSSILSCGELCDIIDGKLHKEEGEWYICQDKADGHDCQNKLGYKYSWKINERDAEKHNLKDLKKVEKTLYNLEIGDIIIDTEGDYRKILSVLPSDKENPLYAISQYTDSLEDLDGKLKTYSNILTAYTLIEGRFTLYNPESLKEDTSTELTIKQLEEKLGITNLKIID